MLHIDSETEKEGGLLRSGRIFWLGKRRMSVTRRRSCRATEGRYYELATHLDEESCNEEEEYQLISE